MSMDGLCRCRLYHADEGMEERRSHWRVYTRSPDILDKKAMSTVGCNRCGRQWKMKAKEADLLPDAMAATAGVP